MNPSGMRPDGSAFYNSSQRSAMSAQQAPQSTNNQPKDNGNFFTKLIPTGGGLAGALAGGASGAALGSIVPGVGTAVGGLLGAILGGAGGSALGKVGENAAEGEKDLSKGVLNEALIGGATSIPITAGLKLARAGIKVATGIGKTGAGELVQQAGVQAMPRFAVAKAVDSGNLDPNLLDRVAKVAPQNGVQDVASTSLTGKMQNKADSMLASQYGAISKPTIRSTNPAMTVGQLSDIGIVKPTDAERLANELTGTNGHLNQLVVKASGNARNIDTGGLRDIFNSAADNAGLVGNERKSLDAIFQSKMGMLNGGAKGSLNGATASDTLSTIKNIEGEVASLLGKDGRYHIPTMADKRQADVLTGIGNELKDRLYGQAGANDNLKALLTPELRGKLVDLMPGNTKWANYVDKNIMGATTIKDMRSAQAPFVNISKIIDDAANNNFSVGGKMINNPSSLKDALMQGAANIAVNPVRRSAATVLKTVAGNSAEKAVKPVGQGVLGAAGRQVFERSLIPSDNQSATRPDSLTQQLTDGTYGQPAMEQPSPQTSSPFGYSSEELGQALMKAYSAGDVASAKALESMYQHTVDYEKMQSKTNNPQPGFSKPSASQYSQAKSGMASVNQLMSIVQKDPSIINKVAIPGQKILGIGGLESGLLGTSNYNAITNNILNSIARINTGANMPASEQAFYTQTYLPQPGDSQETLASKMQTLQGFFSPIVNYREASVGGGDLASALNAAGY